VLHLKLNKQKANLNAKVQNIARKNSFIFTSVKIQIMGARYIS
jgi:hypothetical protein